MRAIVQNGYGAPEKVLSLAEVDRPVMKAGNDVLIRVKATSVNTPDWITVTGTPKILRLRFGLRQPPTPIRGTDFAGVVEAVGADVTHVQPGDEVFGSTWANGLASPGTFAEFTVAPATHLIKKPPELSFEDAGASVMSGLTAMIAMADVAKVGPGKRVLINGASGGVGTFAVQIARKRGADVTGVCGPANIDLVKSLGAYHVVDYTSEEFTRAGRLYDVIFDNVINRPPKEVAGVLTPNGMLIPNSVGNTGGMLAGLPRMIRAFLMGMGGVNVKSVRCVVNHETLGAMAKLLVSGGVNVVTDRVYPLAQTPAAVAHMLAHHAAGNVVIRV